MGLLVLFSELDLLNHFTNESAYLALKWLIDSFGDEEVKPDRVWHIMNSDCSSLPEYQNNDALCKCVSVMCKSLHTLTTKELNLEQDECSLIH